MATFELWKRPIALSEHLQIRALEHTYIVDPFDQVEFVCMGISSTVGASMVFNQIIRRPQVPNCYRRNETTPRALLDTAGLGYARTSPSWPIYAWNGVCHQAANLFLIGSGRLIRIPDGVKGYRLSSALWGPYGTYAPPFQKRLSKPWIFGWINKVWMPCSLSHSVSVFVSSPPPSDLYEKLHSMYEEAASHARVPSPNEILHREFRLLLDDAGFKYDPDKLRTWHMDLLEKKEEIVRAHLENVNMGAEYPDIERGRFFAELVENTNLKFEALIAENEKNLDAILE